MGETGTLQRTLKCAERADLDRRRQRDPKERKENLKSADDGADDEERFRRRRMTLGRFKIASRFGRVRLNRKNNPGDPKRRTAEKRR